MPEERVRGVLWTCSVVMMVTLLLPGRGLAQSAIAGTVKDATGAVMPGVTVEASSPVLIEKTKSAVTDGSGQYRIIDLRPGIYTVTFTLRGLLDRHPRGRRPAQPPSRPTSTPNCASARSRRASPCRARHRWSTSRAPRSSRCSARNCSKPCRPAGTSGASARR